MNCDHAQPLIAAYADGELDALRRLFVEKHLRTCARCAEQHAELLALRRRLRAEAPYFAAPAALTERVRAMVASTPAARPARASRVTEPLRRLSGRVPPRWQWVSGGALGGCAATVLAFVVGTAVIDWQASQNMVAQAVSRHVQATLGDRLVAVVSSDQHTVKPWLSARLDYSPPVHDLASDGFPLLGGRLDTLGGRKVATLVYGYRKHTIDVFVQPDAFDMPSSKELRGFNVAHQRAAGWDWLAVSDAEPQVLDTCLAKLIHAATAQ
ncbi:MAG TPA: zf-HC2 domain-containing protein [Casimicrobiaceae bacterium]|nr:zf-HC2 domain-containing protein [Casimicrobiaceae bacterium]